MLSDVALPGGLAGGQELAAGSFGECLHAHRIQHLVSGKQFLPRLTTASLPAQPLAVEQVRAGQLGPDPRVAQPLDSR
jgi:hypothetical protein